MDFILESLIRTRGSWSRSSPAFGSGDSAFCSDRVLTVAMLDRILQHPTIVNINGESFKVKEKSKAGILTSPANIAVGQY